MEIKAIQATVPSFGAKLKNNEEVNVLVNSMNEKELREFKSALKKMDKHNQGDVIELQKATVTDNEFTSPEERYFLINKSNNDATVKVGAQYNSETGFFQTTAKDIIQSLKWAAAKGTEVYDTLFGRVPENEGEEK